MTKLFRTSAVLLAGLLAFSLTIGCGGGEDEEIETPPASFVSATPPGGEIAVNSTITVTFDNPPIDVIARVLSRSQAKKRPSRVLSPLVHSH